MKSAQAPASAAETGASTKRSIWGLMFVSAALAGAAPRMALAVLFAEISRDLGLSLVQVGIIWGAESLSGILTSVLGGSFSDRFGARASLVAACVIAGVLNAARGFAPNFGALLLLTLLSGPFAALIPINLHKAGAQVFPRRQLALSNGGVSVGMAFGFVLGTSTAATYLSPALGGWGNVLAMAGAASVLVGLAWLAVPHHTGVADRNPDASGMSLVQIVRHVWAVPDVRRICLAVFGFGACVQGVLGYLPLYLRTLGWTTVGADLATSSFHIASMAATIPIALLSDATGQRRMFLLLGSAMLAVATLALPLLPGGFVYAAAVFGGLARDAFMGIFITRLMESEDVGPAYAGGALGLAMTGLRLGGAVAPPLGNSLAELGAGMPFFVWTLFCALPIIVFLRLRDRPAAAKTA